MFTDNEYCSIETGYELRSLGVEMRDFSPTIYEATRFLREKFHYNIYVTSISHESWQYHITKRKCFGDVGYGEDFYSYEDAMREAINKTVAFIKFEKQ